jgi:hypothetical protein
MPYAARNRFFGEEFKESLVLSQGFLEFIRRGGEEINQEAFGASVGMGATFEGGVWEV